MGFLKRPLRTARRLARLAAQPRALVLLYHRVAALPADPQLLGVSPRHFAEHLQVLRREWRPLALAGLHERVSAGNVPARAVILTFDDGYSDNLTAAKPLLERHDVPATVFVATGELGTGRELWWDELERILLWTEALPAELQLTISGKAHRWTIEANTGYSTQAQHRGWTVLDGRSATRRQGAYLELSKLVHPLRPLERAAVMDALRAWAGLGPEGRPSHQLLRPDQLGQLGAGGLVEIGAHTVSHAALSSLGRSDQEQEIMTGKAQLEQWLGQPVTSFAYPFGYRASYTAESIQVLQQGGFARACSNFTGPVLRNTSLFEIPRFVVRDWDGDTFARKLRRWIWDLA